MGIVLVSHSPTLAAGLADLLGQIGSEEVPVVLAAGTAEGGLGTSPDLVSRALAEAERGDGVVVLPDLGSAVLSVKVALEAADTERVVEMVDAPFVEGAVAAAVTAASGGDLADVAAAARGARDVAKF